MMRYSDTVTSLLPTVTLFQTPIIGVIVLNLSCTPLLRIYDRKASMESFSSLYLIANFCLSVTLSTFLLVLSHVLSLLLSFVYELSYHK